MHSKLGIKLFPMVVYCVSTQIEITDDFFYHSNHHKTSEPHQLSKVVFDLKEPSKHTTLLSPHDLYNRIEELRYDPDPSHTVKM